MRPKIKALFEKARALPAADRIALLENMVDSLDYSDPAMERLWAKEADDRMAAYRRGEVAAKEASAVLAKHRSMEAKATTVRFLEIAEIELDEAMHYYRAAIVHPAGHDFLSEVMAASRPNCPRATRRRGVRWGQTSTVAVLAGSPMSCSTPWTMTVSWRSLSPRRRTGLSTGAIF